MKYIELNTFLKKMNLAHSGGEAKIIIQSGVLKVNGIVEKRNKRKLQKNDVVILGEKHYTVAGEICIKEKIMKE